VINTQKIDFDVTAIQITYLTTVNKNLTSASH